VGDEDPWALRVLDLVDEARTAGADPELVLRRAVQALADRFRSGAV
jgi:hypothetical protein